MILAQLLVNGLALGAAYALVALGFVLVLNATGAVNFAQGDLVMAGGFLAVALAGVIPAPGFVLLPLVMALMALLGLAVSATAYLPLRNRPPVSVFISTIAIGIILQNGATVLFGPEPKAAPPLFGGGTFTVAGLQVPGQSLAVIATAALLIAGQYWLFTHTQLGRRLRATAQDPGMARACGIPVTRMIALTFALGAALAGAAGLLLSNQFFVTPSAGSGLILKAYIAVTIGGWGSLAGAVTGALLIATFEVVVSYTLSYTAATAALYLALLAILAVRPQGLFGEAVRAAVPDVLTRGINPLLIAAALALAAYALFGASPYGLRVLTVAGVYAIAVIGYQAIFGQAGALSLAQGTFFGIGAYVTGILGSRYGLGFPVTFPLSILAPTLIALVIAVPVLRLESHYFALATLGIGQVILLAAIEWQSLTGGANGIAGVPGIELFGWRVGRGLPLALFVWALVALGALISWRLSRGRRGAAFPIMRETPNAARTLGIDIDRLRLEAFAISAAYGGAAGALAAHTQRVVSPEVLEFPVMVTILTIAVIGGQGRIAGAIVGAFLLIHLPEWFRGLESGYLILYGAALLATIIAAPWGLVGSLERLRSRIAPERPRAPPGPSAPPPRPAPAAAGPVLYVEGFTKSFGGVQAVSDVSLRLEQGRILGIIGPNGSGKTTLINLITGLETPDGGKLYVSGADITRQPPHRRAQAGVARSFQTATLPPDSTVLEAVTAARIAIDRDLAKARSHAMHFIIQAGIADLVHARCGTLPPGPRRTVELARALARQPLAMLLDEPAAGLTEAEQADLARRLRSAAGSGIAVMIVEHNMPFLLPLADRILCLDEGRTIAEGTPDRVRRDPAVIAAYLGAPA